MLRFDPRPRNRNAGRPPEKDARGFLQFIRGRDCLFVDQGGCEGKIEAAHLDFAGGKGIGTKVADKFAVPMCAGHHRMQHKLGWQTFMVTMKASAHELLTIAQRLWFAWPGRVAWERRLSDG